MEIQTKQFSIKDEKIEFEFFNSFTEKDILMFRYNTCYYNDEVNFTKICETLSTKYPNLRFLFIPDNLKVLKVDKKNIEQIIKELTELLKEI